MPQPRHATYKASLAQAVAFGIVDKVVDALRPLATQRVHTALRRDLLANFPQTHVELLGRLPPRSLWCALGKLTITTATAVSWSNTPWRSPGCRVASPPMDARTLCFANAFLYRPVSLLFLMS